jgi:hypothetical protein
MSPPRLNRQETFFQAGRGIPPAFFIAQNGDDFIHLLHL